MSERQVTLRLTDNVGVGVASRATHHTGTPADVIAYLRDLEARDPDAANVVAKATAAIESGVNDLRITIDPEPDDPTRVRLRVSHDRRVTLRLTEVSSDKTTEDVDTPERIIARLRKAAAAASRNFNGDVASKLMQAAAAVEAGDDRIEIEATIIDDAEDLVSNDPLADAESGLRTDIDAAKGRLAQLGPAQSGMGAASDAATTTTLAEMTRVLNDEDWTPATERARDLDEASVAASASLQRLRARYASGDYGPRPAWVPEHIEWPPVTKQAKRFLKAQLRQDKRKIAQMDRDIRTSIDELADAGILVSGPAVIAIHDALAREHANHHERVLELYNLVVAAAASGAQRATRSREHHLSVSWSTLWALLRQARIFEMRAADYPRLWHTLDVYTTVHIAGERWEEPHDTPEEEAARLADTYKTHLRERAAVTGFPEHLPFDVCYFAWGAIRLSAAQIAARHPKPGDGERGGYLLGHLVTSTGWSFEIITHHFETSKRRDEREGRALAMHLISAAPEALRPEDHGDPWLRPEITLGPWIIPALVNIVNGYDSAVVGHQHTREEKKRYQHLSKRHGEPRIPPPYYVVTLQATTMKHPTRLTRAPRRREYMYRFDVRGHDVHRILRGPLPLDPREQRDLQKRGYRFFSAFAPLDGDAHRILLKRHLAPPRADEWLAVQTKWRQKFIKGPEGKPYIPASRRVPQVRRDQINALDPARLPVAESAAATDKEGAQP